MSSPFLKRDEAQRAIGALSEANSLTIVVGAGSSVEAGLPDWSGLVSALLRTVGREAGCDPGELGTFASWAVRADGLPGSGSMVKAWLDKRFVPAIRDELYSASGDDPRPGPTATCIADLQRAFSGSSEIATLNYDLLLERALRERNGYPASRVKTYVTTTVPKTADVVVRHLHGVLTPSKERGTVVLSESDYHLMQDKNRWQEKYMRKRLETTSCLFVGTSLSDPNLLRYLYRSRPGAQHVAVFVRQADDWWFDADLAAVRAARESAVLKRWRSVNVTPLLADYFSQSAQFVYEVAARRRLGASYLSYHDRLVEWERRIEATLLRKSSKHFTRSQEALQQLLYDWSNVVRGYLKDQGLLASGEHLGLHLWVRDPSSRSLVRLASSARIWRDRHTVQRVPIERPTNWVAVEAFCAGTVIAQRPDKLSRWNYVLGLPVVIDDAAWGRLPVGVLTLASTATPDVSGLALLSPAEIDDVAYYLTGNAANLLTP